MALKCLKERKWTKKIDFCKFFSMALPKVISRYFCQRTGQQHIKGDFPWNSMLRILMQEKMSFRIVS